MLQGYPANFLKYHTLKSHPIFFIGDSVIGIVSIGPRFVVFQSKAGLEIFIEVVIEVGTNEKILRIAHDLPGTQLCFKEEFEFRVDVEEAIVNIPAAQLIFGLAFCR